MSDDAEDKKPEHSLLNRLRELRKQHAQARERGSKLVPASKLGFFSQPGYPEPLVEEPSLEEWEKRSAHYHCWLAHTFRAYLALMIRGIDPHKPENKPVLDFEFAERKLPLEWLRYHPNLDLPTGASNPW